MPNLTDEEKILAWESSWHPSFAGMAIVTKDFKFRGVNPQFCEILGVTPADLLENKFADITHPKYKKIDEKNACLVREGKIDYYLLRKSYLFEDGREVRVILLVTRVPNGDAPFKFFLSRIMLDEEIPSSLDISPRPSMLKGMELLVKNSKTVIGFAALIATIIATFIGTLG